MTKPNKTSPRNQFTSDITIVGGGLVGMAAALALSKLGLKIHLIEHIAIKDDSHPSYDDRTLVVNRASIRFWENIGIWKELSSDLTPIKKVHVSNKGHFGTVNFKASDYNLDALANIIEAKKLGMALQNKIQQTDNITVVCPAQVTGFDTITNGIKIDYCHDNTNHSIISQLMLAADGAQSQIRKKLGLETHIKSYQRTAIICNITPENKHDFCAYERLTHLGPTAILPFVNNRCGFVWTVNENKAEAIIKLNDQDFLKKAQQQFGYRLGKFIKVGKRSSYPLYLVTVPKQVKSRTILIGNAAHSMSPVSAQGLNLAIRDVANLIDIIDSANVNKQDIGSSKVLKDYQNAVNYDQNQTLKYTDGLMSWFKINNPIINSFRSMGLVALDNVSHLKFNLFTKASGFRDKTTKLLRQQ